MNDAYPGRRLAWASILAGAALSLIASYGVAKMSLVLGSPAGHWVYDYIEGFHRRSLEVAVVACGLCGGLLFAIPRGWAARHPWRSVVLWIVLGFAVQGLLRTGTPYTFEQMFVSDGSSSFYTPTLQYPAGVMLRDFDRLRPTLPTHARSNMPGKLMLVYALERLSSRPAVLAWLVVALSNLGGVLLYVFVWDLLEDRAAALTALIFYLFAPGKLFFFPVLNTVTPTVALAFACLWCRSQRTGRLGYAALAGVVLYATAFYEPLPLVMGLVFAALLGRRIWLGETTVREAAVASAVVALGFVATYAAVYATFQFELFGVARRVAADAVAFNQMAGRPYAIWVGQNLFDFAFGAGLCQTSILVVSVGFGLASRQRAAPIVTFAVALCATVLVLDLLGVNRGEVVRLWIFLACFAQIPAAYYCARLDSRAALLLVLAATLLQDALGTAMMAFGAP